MRDDNYGQMIFGDLVDLKLPDICLAGEEKTPKNLTQETCSDRGSNPGALHDRHTCYRLLHTGEPEYVSNFKYGFYDKFILSINFFLNKIDFLIGFRMIFLTFSVSSKLSKT